MEVVLSTLKRKTLIEKLFTYFTRFLAVLFLLLLSCNFSFVCYISTSSRCFDKQNPNYHFHKICKLFGSWIFPFFFLFLHRFAFHLSLQGDEVVEGESVVGGEGEGLSVSDINVPVQVPLGTSETSVTSS